jgi:general secretion pathway protein D
MMTMRTKPTAFLYLLDFCKFDFRCHSEAKPKNLFSRKGPKNEILRGVYPEHRKERFFAAAQNDRRRAQDDKKRDFAKVQYLITIWMTMLWFTLSPTLFAVSTARAEQEPSASDQKGLESKIVRLELKQAKVADALRLISELSGINAVATEEAGKRQISLYLQEVTARQAIDTLAKISNLWYREDKETRTFRVMTTEEFQKDLIIFREDFTRVFNLLHHNTVSLARVIADLYGDRVLLSLGEDEGDSLTGNFGFSGNTGQAAPFSRPVSAATSEESRGAVQSQRGIEGRRASEQEVKESFTPDQISELMRRLKETPPEDQDESAAKELLHGISRREPPIFVTVVRQHNAIVLRTADARVMKDIEALIQDLDRPTPQVLLEMKILRLGLGDGFRSIFDFDLTRGQVIAGPPTGQPRNPLLPNAGVGPQNVLGLGNFALEGGTFLYQFMNDQIRARIQLLAQENRLEVLATPMVLASNNRPARVFVGEQRVLVTGVKSKVVTPATGAATTVIEPVTEIRDIGNTLLIQPKINADRTVTLLINQDSSRVLVDSTTIPVATETGEIREIPIDTVDTAILQGTVVAKDGLSVAVGGLIQNNFSNDKQKVPFLAEIPLLGWFFKREARDQSKSELVLLITPHVLMTPTEGQEATDTLMKEKSDHPYFKEDDRERELRKEIEVR